MDEHVSPETFHAAYATVYQGDTCWRELEAPQSDAYRWVGESTYIRRPPFFDDMSVEPPPPEEIEGARVLAVDRDGASAEATTTRAPASETISRLRTSG